MNLNKIIREEIDDWSWTEVDVNPWSEYNIILFDITPTREDVNKYIEMALSTKAISNYEAWQSGRENDIDYIIGYTHSPRGGVLIAVDELSYADYDTYEQRLKSRQDNIVKYSQLIGKDGLTESKEFDWIRDTDPMDIKFNVGDRVRVHNIGSNSAFIEWLGDYSDDYLNGKYGEYIEGLVRDAKDENQFCILTNSGVDRIYFPYKKQMEHLSDKNPYQGLDLFYEPI